MSGAFLAIYIIVAVLCFGCAIHAARRRHVMWSLYFAFSVAMCAWMIRTGGPS